MRNVSRKLLFTTSAVALALAGTVRLSAAPVLQLNFPASWPGTGTTVTDQSSAHNNGIVSTTVTKDPTLSTTQLPAGAAAGTSSLVTNTGGTQTTATQLLTNPIVAAAGGFTYTAKFRWDGTDNANHIEKIVDYAGTESMQVDSINAAAGTANLDFIFTTQGVAPAPDTTVGPTVPILANTWYTATATFNTQGNAVAGDGSLAGLASLILTPDGGPTVTSSLAVAKTTYGDTLNRPLAVGELGFPSTTSALVLFNGDIYSASVNTGAVAVPEPTSLALTCLAAPLLLGRRRRRQGV